MIDLAPLAAHAVELLALLGLTLLSAAAGDVLLDHLGLRRGFGIESGGVSPPAILERMLFAVALGYGSLAYLTFALGLAGVLYGPLMASLLLVCGIGLRRRLGTAARRASILVRSLGRAVQDPLILVLTSVSALMIGVALIKALAPPISQDDMCYHLAIPARYVRSHRIDFQPDSSFSLIPQVVEMLATLGLLFGSDRLAVLFSFTLGILGPLAAAAYCRRYLVPKEGRARIVPWLACAIFLSTPLVGFVLRAVDADLAQAAFGFLAIFGIARAFETAREAGLDDSPPAEAWAFLVLAGICSGLSVSSKYFGFPVAIGVGLALVGYGVRRRSPFRLGGRLLLAYGLPAVAVVAPWLLRNVLAAGNPVWPLASRFFGGRYCPLGPSLAYEPANLATGWKFMVDAIARRPIEIDGHVHVVSLGPLLLPLILLLGSARVSGAFAWIVFLAAETWLVSASTFPRSSTRYFAGFYLFAAVIGAVGVASLTDRFRGLRLVWATILACAFGLLAADSARSVGEYLPTVFAGNRFAETMYLRKHMEDEQMLEFISASVPSAAKIYLWDSLPRGYRMPRDYVYARLVPRYTDFGDADLVRWRQRLDELGITHVLYHPRNPINYGLPAGFVDPYAGAAERFLPRFCGAPIFQVGSYSLYLLR